MSFWSYLKSILVFDFLFGHNRKDKHTSSSNHSGDCIVDYDFDDLEEDDSELGYIGPDGARHLVIDLDIDFDGDEAYEEEEEYDELDAIIDELESYEEEECYDYGSSYNQSNEIVYDDLNYDDDYNVIFEAD